MELSFLEVFGCFLVFFEIMALLPTLVFVVFRLQTHADEETKGTRRAPQAAGVFADRRLAAISSMIAREESKNSGTWPRLLRGTIADRALARAPALDVDIRLIFTKAGLFGGIADIPGGLYAGRFNPALEEKV